ncbi:PQQ-binding-like beta-propeller repeat protein [Mycolicibacterium rufum]|uniref:PQQ-binding-like beta-propeller repeat protein n=1 Tax=Mycolicibacterium rufum TaxID=318424 RepID=A0A9X2Y9W4_9MYCO|nr:PQQ-binding-like beta-propeller repeat protein [Mycolicibacterium rufum]KGI67630.1 pyrrolo-quinoline quinone [Mycolicibacterium rufum]MCV7069373.1 PQQ-like beta-propeller repeat protein [Mycolicibacterium rufum]ULP38605.1 PQQ-binding-like beta-propeller repeat protein [Mycolicibacterium rufum]
MLRRIIVLATTVLIAVLAGCGSTDSWVDARAASGWAAQYADAANSSSSPVSGADTLRLEWVRSVKGDLAAQAALGSGNYLAVNGQTAGGCSLMVWETNNRARQRWCTRLYQGGGLASPLFDGFDNLYIGQPGLVMSYPVTQWIRWRQPVIGMPMTMRFLDPDMLLVVTHLGQVLVFDAHRGTVAGSSMDLVAGVNPRDSERGLQDCRLGGPGCPVAAAPAFSGASNVIVLTLWEPGAEAPVVVGLRYRPGQTPLITREWTSEAVGRSPLASPVLSPDGATAYVNGRDERLWAINTDDGSAKWSVPLGYLAQTPPSVNPDGLIVAGGGPGARLTAIRDTGDGPEKVWSRDDVAPLSTSSLAGVGYTVVGDGDGMALTVFALGDGHTVNSYRLPGATGWPVGVSIGHDRRVVTATSDGRVYGFAAA